MNIYRFSPLDNRKKITPINSGMNCIIFCCEGSVVVCGVIFVIRYIVIVIAIGKI